MSAAERGNPMRVLVTGGAGYIGSHTARLLADAGHEVTVIDRVDSRFLAAIAPVVVEVGDIGDAALLGRILHDRGIEAVVHLAGDKSVEASLVDPGGYFANNVSATLVLLRTMVAAGVRELVFSSTCAVYGPTNRPPLTEAANLDPQTPYGESKLLVERMLRWFEVAHGLRSVCLRYFNAAGASEDARIGEDWTTAVNLVPMVMKAAAGVLPVLKVFGRDYETPDGTAIRDYIHVMDLASAHGSALRHLRDGGTSSVLNLGTGRGASVLEVVQATERASGRTIPVEFAPRRAGDLPAVWADSSKAMSVLHWHPQHDLDSIVGSAWRWHAQLLAAQRSG